MQAVINLSGQRSVPQAMDYPVRACAGVVIELKKEIMVEWVFLRYAPQSDAIGIAIMLAMPPVKLQGAIPAQCKQTVLNTDISPVHSSS